jgi:hypothetical protein
MSAECRGREESLLMDQHAPISENLEGDLQSRNVRVQCPCLLAHLYDQPTRHSTEPTRSRQVELMLWNLEEVDCGYRII